MKTEDEDVKREKSIRILGWEINERLSMDVHLQQSIGKVKCMMSRMSELKQYMNDKQRLQFANAYMMSVLRYGAQFLAGKKVTVR